MSKKRYPVVILATYDDPPELDHVATLSPVSSLVEAIEAAEREGYEVLQVDHGGLCELGYGLNDNPAYVVTIEPDQS